MLPGLVKRARMSLSREALPSTGVQQTAQRYECQFCHKTFLNQHGLLSHQKTSTACVLTRTQLEYGPDDCHPNVSNLSDALGSAIDDVQEAAQDMRAFIASGLANIRTTLLDGLTSMHYEHYVRHADIQRSKELMAHVMAKQRETILDVLQNADVTDAASLEPYIAKIMDAVGPIKSRQAEDRARDKAYAYKATPRRRCLGEVAEETNVKGRGSVRNTRTMYCWDMPLEEVLQRQLYYDDEFANYVRDLHECQQRTPGRYDDIISGSVIREHPELGNPNYEGPDRLAFAIYYDDVEVCNPLGAARGKQKLGLIYVQLLNLPPHLRNRLNMIFLATVVLHRDMNEAGAYEVLQGGDPEHGEQNHALGPTLRRWGSAAGVALQVLRPKNLLQWRH